MRSTLAVLSVIVLAACGDDGPSRLDLDEVRIVKVAGDQAAVAGTSQATPLHSVSASPRFAVTAGEAWTPEPLVGRIETVGARTHGISGPSMLPPDMLAHWHLPEEAGRLLASSTPPDDSLHIVNRWAPSTRAGEYTAVARRILADGSVHEDARWTLVVEPGPVATLTTIVPSPYTIIIGEGFLQRDVLFQAQDQYGNSWPAGTVSWDWPDPTYHPTVEGYDTLTASAGGLEREFEVVALEPIGPGWVYEIRCEGGPPPNSSTVIDSLMVTLVVDSVDMAAYVGSKDGYYTGGELYGQYTAHVYRQNGSEMHDEHDRWSFRFWRRPGGVLIGIAIGEHPLYREGDGAFTDPDACGPDAATIYARFQPPAS